MRNELRSYSRLSQLSTFDDRLHYLRIDGVVGASTFGMDRYLNQSFYHSREWKQVRDFVITRDLGCDLGVSDLEIEDSIYVHHMNPITPDSFEASDVVLLDPEYLICCSFNTHQFIHYGRVIRRAAEYAPRRPNDTCPWK